MKRETLLKLSNKEIDAYAQTIGVDVSGCKTKALKADAIEKARARVADIQVMGITLHIPVKRLHNLNITTRLNGQITSDAELMDITKQIIGDEQMDKLYAACTDDDGTIDSEAVSLAIATIITSEELKNF